MKEAIGGVGIEEGARRMSSTVVGDREEGRGSGGSKNKSMLETRILYSGTGL